MSLFRLVKGRKKKDKVTASSPADQSGLSPASSTVTENPSSPIIPASKQIRARNKPKAKSGTDPRWRSLLRLLQWPFKKRKDRARESSSDTVERDSDLKENARPDRHQGRSARTIQDASTAASSLSVTPTALDGGTEQAALSSSAAAPPIPPRSSSRNINRDLSSNTHNDIIESVGREENVDYISRVTEIDGLDHPWRQHTSQERGHERHDEEESRTFGRENNGARSHQRRVGAWNDQDINAYHENGEEEDDEDDEEEIEWSEWLPTR